MASVYTLRSRLPDLQDYTSIYRCRREHRTTRRLSWHRSLPPRSPMLIRRKRRSSASSKLAAPQRFTWITCRTFRERQWQDRIAFAPNQEQQSQRHLSGASLLTTSIRVTFTSATQPSGLKRLGISGTRRWGKKIR